MTGRGFVALLLAAALGACARQPSTPAVRVQCQPAALEQAALAALAAGQQAQAMAEMLECVSNADQRAQAWASRACTPEGAWQLGLAGLEPPTQCDMDDRWWREGHELGLAYGQIRGRLAEIETTQQGDTGPSTSSFERVKLIRERDSIRGIAQIKGWPLPEDLNRTPTP